MTSFDDVCVDEAHAELLKAVGAKSKAESARFRAEQIEAMIENVKSIDNSVQRISGNHAHSDRTEELIERMEETIEICFDAAERWLHVMERVMVVLERMDNRKHAAILEMHYVAGASWDDTASAFGYSGPGIYNVRRKALRGFYEAMIHGLPDAYFESL